MASSSSDLGALIVQLHNRTNETKEAFDQALVELERQKTDYDKRYQEQLDQLKEERRKWDEEKATMKKLIAKASPIIDLNVGGEKMSTSRATMTLVEGTLLATMFSGKWEDKLIKDANGSIFLDYDPVLFKYLLNQLRAWSEPSTKRLLRLPIGSEQAFLELVRLLKFDERFIDGVKNISTPSATVIQPEREVETFRLTDTPSFRMTDNGRVCEKIAMNSYQCVFGTMAYSTGIHRIRLRLEKGITNILLGICSQNNPPTGPNFYDKPTTHGWFAHKYVITNGIGSFTNWSAAQVNDVLELTLNCDGRSLSILNERSRVQDEMRVNINHAPFPWCVLVVLNSNGDQVRLL